MTTRTRRDPRAEQDVRRGLIAASDACGAPAAVDNMTTPVTIIDNPAGYILVIADMPDGKPVVARPPCVGRRGLPMAA